MNEAELRLTRHLRRLATRTNDPGMLAWGERAARLRWIDGAAAGIFAETCPDCLGVVAGSAAGSTRVEGQVEPRYLPCLCGTRVDIDDLTHRHGVYDVLSRNGTQSATGQPQD